LGIGDSKQKKTKGKTMTRKIISNNKNQQKLKTLQKTEATKTPTKSPTALKKKYASWVGNAIGTCLSSWVRILVCVGKPKGGRERQKRHLG